MGVLNTSTHSDLPMSETILTLDQCLRHRDLEEHPEGAMVH